MSTRWLLEWWTPWHEYLFTMKQNSFHHLPHLGFLCNVTQHHHLSLKFWSGAECPTCTDGRAEVSEPDPQVWASCGSDGNLGMGFYDPRREYIFHHRPNLHLCCLFIPPNIIIFCSNLIPAMQCLTSTDGRAQVLLRQIQWVWGGY